MYKTIDDYDLKNKKVIIRCDFNVPIKNGIITDDTRIRESLKTIKYAVSQNAKIILLSHLGKINSKDDLKQNDLFPIANRLEKLLNKKIIFSNDTTGPLLEEKVSKLKSGEILLIQNTRYEDLINNRESSNNKELGKYWASLGDIFINDAFGTLHRSHASNVGIGSSLPNGIGYLVKKELDNLLPPINNPKRPYTVILGGSKVSDKLGLIKYILKKADYIIIGGGMANTFLYSLGINVGKSKIELNSFKNRSNKINYVTFCKSIMKKYNEKILLPIDAITTKTFENNKGIQKEIYKIDRDDYILDIGEKTISKFIEIIKDSKQIIWNGPMGVFEFSNFLNGTKSLCEAIGKNKGTTIIGGGDTASAVLNLCNKNLFTHISTGGGATLELLEGKELPGLMVIDRK